MRAVQIPKQADHQQHAQYPDEIHDKTDLPLVGVWSSPSPHDGQTIGGKHA